MPLAPSHQRSPRSADYPRTGTRGAHYTPHARARASLPNITDNSTTSRGLGGRVTRRTARSDAHKSDARVPKVSVAGSSLLKRRCALRRCPSALVPNRFRCACQLGRSGMIPLVTAFFWSLISRNVFSDYSHAPEAALVVAELASTMGHKKYSIDQCRFSFDAPT